MLKRLAIVVALVGVVVLPFALRPKRSADQSAVETLVLITPHNEAIRSEFGRAFRDWYKAKTGRTIFVDWRVIGGTAEIARFLESEYVASFQLHWRRDLKKEWSTEVQGAFQAAQLAPDASSLATEAREVFLKSNVSCGIDLFFGGGPADFRIQAAAGRLVDCGILGRHPEWFRDDVIPHEFAGEEYWDLGGRWIGTVLSSYGMIANLDSLASLGVGVPSHWSDLTNPRLQGEIALADPTKSSSIAKAFENVIQQQMQTKLSELRRDNPAQDPKAAETQAIREGWIAGLRLMQLISANSRYFTDSSQKPPIDVAQGNAAAGICIDFYGRQQDEAVRRRSGATRLKYVSPPGGTVSSVDPIGLLRGAPNREAALAFIDFVLSEDGQKLWNFRPGTPGGPQHYAIRRLPVRRDFYAREDFMALRSDPEASPFSGSNQLVYRAAWSARLTRELALIIRIMGMDTHQELVGAWKAIIAAGFPPEALAVLQDLSRVDYDQALGPIKQGLSSRNKADEIRLVRELGEAFRAQYRRAEEIARRAGPTVGRPTSLQP